MNNSSIAALAACGLLLVGCKESAAKLEAAALREDSLRTYVSSLTTDLKRAEERIRAVEERATAAESRASAAEEQLAEKARRAGRPIAEFRALPRATGNALVGYNDIQSAISAEAVVAQFGSPVRSQDQSGFIDEKFLFYRTTDEFDNAAFARLQFVKACRSGSGLGCYALVAVDAVPQ